MKAATAAVAASRPPLRLPRRMPARAALWSTSAGSGSAVGDDKVLHLVRHGETEMNVHLRGLPDDRQYGSPHFVDPLIPDTRLTATGRAQAQAAHRTAARLAPAPEVLVVSPLTRALQTAELLFDGFRGPRLAHHLAAERLYLSSDVGRPRPELEQEFPAFSFEALPPSGAWWHPIEGAGAAAGGQEGGSRQGSEEEEEELEDEDAISLIEAHEPPVAFLRRVERLRQWLAARPEGSIALVAHWGVLHALTGAEFRNCELRSLRLGDLKARPHLLRRREAAGRPA